MHTNVIRVSAGHDFHTIATTASNAPVFNNTKIFMCLLKAALDFLWRHVDISGRIFYTNEFVHIDKDSVYELFINSDVRLKT